jgi:hypothetical protein
MKRDSVLEYRHAMQRRTKRMGIKMRGPDDWTAGLRDVVVERDPGFADRSVVPAWLRRTRRLAIAGQTSEEFGEAIRVLQRHNPLLRARFGVGWPEAAAVVHSEAQRRGASVVALAKVLAAGLRSERQGGGV